jgi:hypothetical protein
MNNKKLNVTMPYVRGVQLWGNPQLIATSQKKEVSVTGPTAAVRIYNRIRAAGAQGVPLVKITRRSRYHRWLTRALIKARLIVAQERIA